jgi:hypothetical protein
MNEQIKRLADGIIHFAATNGSADDIKAALKLAIKQVNQVQHREEQKRAAAERAREEEAGARAGAMLNAPIDPEVDYVDQHGSVVAAHPLN